MLRLTTLGSIRLTGREEISHSPHPILGQPKRLALLLYLALARPGSLVFRDTLVALLWPDYETLRARRALRQTLHHLRLELGPELILGPRAESVGLDPALLWCDAVELERAALEDRLETVLELYGGEFVSGFHPQCGPEYERWLDETRDRLRHRATVAAAVLADRAEAGGDVRAAIDYVQRLVELRPYDEQATRLLIRLLAKTGDRAGAVTAYQGLAARLAGQLELVPEARTRLLAEAVRSGQTEAADYEPPWTTDERVPRAGDMLPDRSGALAVLPFAALSGSPSEKLLADGLVELLITELTRRGCVPVLSRTSVQNIRQSGQGLPAVAKALGAELVVEGTVLESGNRLRVTAQLLRASPERHLWADSFERALVDPLTDQAELAVTVARSIESALGSRSDGRDTDSGIGAAREAHFRARCQLARMSPEGFAEALRLCEEAIRLDARFARGHATLAFALTALARTGRVAPWQAFGEARRRARTALELDPHLAEAHMVLGACATFLDRDWSTAEACMRQGLELDPSLADSHWCYSNLLLITGRPAEARRAARRARELDPVLPTLWLNEVLIDVGAGALAEAETSAVEFAAFHRDGSASAFALGMVREAKGDHAAAAAHFAHAEELGGGAHSIAGQGYNLARAGQVEPAQRQLDRLLHVSDRYVPATSIARVCAGLGQVDEAFRWLERAAIERDDWLLFMDCWPRFEPLRQDPRFHALRRRLSLPLPEAALAAR